MVRIKKAETSVPFQMICLLNTHESAGGEVVYG